MDIAKLLADYLETNNLKVPAIARSTGIPGDRIRKWLKGTKPSKLEDYEKIGKLLGIKMESVPHETMDPYELENKIFYKDMTKPIDPASKLIDTLIYTNKQLVETNAHLFERLFSLEISSGAVKETPLKHQVYLSPQGLKRAARLGVPDLWPTVDEGLLILGKLLGVNPDSKEE